MYGSPVGRVATSRTRTTCGLLMRTLDDLGAAGELGQHDLHGHLLIEVEVPRAEDDTHAADAEHGFDAALAVQHFAHRWKARREVVRRLVGERHLRLLRIRGGPAAGKGRASM